MAAASLRSATSVLSRLSAGRSTLLCFQRLRLLSPSVVPVFSQSCRSLCVAAQESGAVEAESRYRERPWEYLLSEEYAEKYGDAPVWAGYRRNHKGGIPPQKTRRTCIRGGHLCGNACPICRDSNIIINPQNVKLLQQFISPHTGVVYDPTRTGVCMKQQKALNLAVSAARDHGLLPFQIPHVEFTGEDYSNSHAAVGTTPPPTSTAPDSWYSWYKEISPDETEVDKAKKTYKAYLK